MLLRQALQHGGILQSSGFFSSSSSFLSGSPTLTISASFFAFLSAFTTPTASTAPTIVTVLFSTSIAIETIPAVNQSIKLQSDATPKNPTTDAISACRPSNLEMMVMMPILHLVHITLTFNTIFCNWTPRKPSEHNVIITMNPFRRRRSPLTFMSAILRYDSVRSIGSLYSGGQQGSTQVGSVSVDSYCIGQADRSHRGDLMSSANWCPELGRRITHVSHRQQTYVQP
ncbi:hypothetical protein OPV22_008866 [Ensete ventricosum]|uniref:Uncharacterized protein n=1 Tax=Ensete ventricosum TaxID=4639 RepID=A0AAV8RFP5_ENSVE|nr:hypothetical protein OPV22_008866 [Ensete ventricosum]